MSVRSVELGRIDELRRMSEVEAAYIAGFVDADGSFFIARANMSDQRRPQFRATLSIANTNFELLRDLQQTMGVGSLNCGYRRKQNPNWKDKGQLNVRSTQLAELLPQIAPYLRLKHEQACLVQNLLSLKSVWSKANDNWEEQDRLYHECKRLNGRGPENQPEVELSRATPEKKTCKEAECGGKHYSEGLCRRHYRWMYESQKWQPGETRECQVCSSALPRKASISQKFCGGPCRMKWYRKNGNYAKRRASKGGLDG